MTTLVSAIVFSHVEKFGLSIKNLNNLWSFINVYAVFVPNLCGEKSVWRKNDKYEGCPEVAVIVIVLPVVIAHWRAGVCIASCS